MGLLEKAKQQKQTTLESEAVLDLDNSGQNLQKKERSSGLLERAKQKKLKQISEKTDTVQGKEYNKISEKKSYDGLNIKTGAGKEIIDEKKGFGYKGLGIRRIVFDNSINEYVYEVTEPVLNEDEIEIKEELSHLFKMLADVNISGSDKEEKKKYLEETLEQIIVDNSVKFGPRYKSLKKKGKGLSKNKDKQDKKKQDEPVTQ